MPSNDISQKVIEHLQMKLIKITSLILFTAFGVLAQASPAGREWRLTYLIGVDLRTKSPSLRIDADGKRFSGNTSCNIMNGSVNIGRGSITFNAIITTKRACTIQTAKIESGILSALGRVNRFKASQNHLRIYAGNRLLMQFEAMPPSNIDDEAKPVADQLGLEDRKWILESIADAPIPKVQEDAFINFNPEKGSAGGNTSCNAFGGSYSTEGNKVRIFEIISTMRACIEDERMNIERAFLDGLRETDRYEIRGDKLMLYRRDKLLLTFRGRKK